MCSLSLFPPSSIVLFYYILEFFCRFCISWLLTNKIIKTILSPSPLTSIISMSFIKCCWWFNPCTRDASAGGSISTDTPTITDARAWHASSACTSERHSLPQTGRGSPGRKDHAPTGGHFGAGRRADARRGGWLDGRGTCVATVMGTIDK